MKNDKRDITNFKESITILRTLNWGAEICSAQSKYEVPKLYK